MRASNCAIRSGCNSTVAAPRFSSRCAVQVVPGTATTCSPRDSTQASASCAMDACAARASLAYSSSSCRFAAYAAGANRGIVRRKSLASSEATSRRAPVRNPRASGLKATKVAPRLRQASITAISGLRVHNEYSLCTAAIGCTACARRSVSADTSDRPMARIFPSRTNSLSAPTLSSMGTALSQRCR